MVSSKVVCGLVVVGLVACVLGQAQDHPPAGSEEERRLASNFGFQDGQTPPPGALASPSHSHPAPGSESGGKPQNFGFKPGQTPPPGAMASPSKH